MDSAERMRRVLAGLPIDIDDFLHSLGRFVSTFSQTETLLQKTLWRLAGVKPPVAQAILSGVRVDQALSLMGRIAEAKKWSKKRTTALERFSSQLSLINKLRNDILHFGAELNDPHGWLVSNKDFVHIAERIRETNLTVSLLDNANWDLHTINDHIGALAWRREIPREAWPQFEESLSRAWRYKPPSPKPNSKRTRDRRLNQKAPRKPSRR